MATYQIVYKAPCLPRIDHQFYPLFSAHTVRALMSQLLDQHNKLIDNLKKRDNIIQKKFNALDDRLGLSSLLIGL